MISTCTANTAGLNPYTAIVDRNTFGLRPPTKVEPPPPPAPPASKIKLQGITTILGRKQVLFKTQVPAKPPEYPAPRELAMVLSEGQRDGDVEVLEINPEAGTVKFNNAGKIESLNMADDSDKPTPGAAAPAAGGVPAPAMPKIPGVRPPAAPPVAATPTQPSVSSADVSPFGASETRVAPTIPTRTLRSSGNAFGGVNTANSTAGSATEVLAAQQAVAVQRTPEENVILYEANRLRREASGNSFIKFPPHPALKGLQGTGANQ